MSSRDLEHILDARLPPVQSPAKFSRLMRNLSAPSRRERILVAPDRAAQLDHLADVALAHYHDYIETTDDWYPHREISRIKTLQHSLSTGHVGRALYDAACLDILYGQLDYIGPERTALIDTIRGR